MAVSLQHRHTLTTVFRPIRPVGTKLHHSRAQRSRPAARHAASHRAVRMWGRRSLGPLWQHTPLPVPAVPEGCAALGAPAAQGNAAPCQCGAAAAHRWRAVLAWARHSPVGAGGPGSGAALLLGRCREARRAASQRLQLPCRRPPAGRCWARHGRCVGPVEGRGAACLVEGGAAGGQLRRVVACVAAGTGCASAAGAQLPHMSDQCYAWHGGWCRGCGAQRTAQMVCCCMDA